MMNRFISIFRATTVVTVLFALLVTSCEKPEAEGAFEVFIPKSVVDSRKGSQFVNVKCSGAWTLALVSDEGEVDWARLKATSGTGNRNNIILEYEINDTEHSRELRIVLDNGTKWTECSMIQNAADAQPDPDPDPAPVPDQDLTKTGWLELPAMDDPDLGYYSHSFALDGKTYRNYSFGWSQKDLVAVWVAYPLCRFYTNGSAGRTNAWAYDPLLGSLSAAPFGGYAEELARGHQIPSADRQCCYDANAQTFYGTNMTPQINAHNEGIWSDLEGKVRGWANASDTLYVATGVVLEGSTRTTYDSDGKSITVPSAYFKAVLKYSRASTLGTWNAAAFYLEHRAYSESLGKAHSMSVDELEEITGIDFFVNLPAKVGETEAARLEAAVPASSSVWW